jgi:hypothetical protein
MSKKKGTHKVNRSSITGQFVSAEYAKKHPNTTETETVKNSSTSEKK